MIINFFRSIGYPIGTPSNIYEENQATFKKIPGVHNHSPSQTSKLTNHLYPQNPSQNIFDMVDTRSNMQLSDLNYKPHGRKSLRNIIDNTIGSFLYTPLGSGHYKRLFLDQFHGPSRISCDQEKKSEIIMMKLSNSLHSTMNTHANEI